LAAEQCIRNAGGFTHNTARFTAVIHKRGTPMQNNKSLRGTVRVAVSALLLGGLPAQAHHSITGEFDTETTFEIKGTLTKLDWANPHLWYYLDVTAADGSVEKWQCTT